MQPKYVYLGRVTIDSPLATGSAQDLSEGETLKSLSGWRLANIHVKTRTVGTMTSTATMQLRTGNNTAATAAMAPTTNPQTDGTVITKHITMADADGAGAWNLVVAGSAASVDSGSWDFYGEFLPPVT